MGNVEQDFRNDSHVCGDWLLHHDNAPAHSSILVQQFLSKHSIALLRQPPYSTDIAPRDLWLFPKLKKPLKRQQFDEKTTIENNVTSVLKAIPKSEFQDCFEKWKHRWNRVIQSSGDYRPRIQCSNCTAPYIGTTKRPLKTRIHEHEKEFYNPAEKWTTSIKHAWHQDHKFNFDEVTIIDRSDNYRKRMILTMTHKATTAHSVNQRTDTQNLSVFYLPFLNNQV